VVRDLSEYEVVGRVIESRLLDEAVARLLESKYLWLLVDEVARSPSVTAAISHQGVGFAEQMAGAVRDRSQVADARMERRARRLFRRETPDGHE
jgi:aspartate aminotransferase-like enzyme